MANDKQLTLGTLFEAKPEKLLAALKKIKTQINMIATAANQLQSSMDTLNNAVKAGQSAMKGYALSSNATVSAIKGAAGESLKFKQALGQLNSVAAKTKTGFDTAYSTLMKVEKAIHVTGQQMTAAGKNGQEFVNTANRMSLVNQVLAGKLKATSTGFQKVIEKTSTLEKQKASLINKYSEHSKKLSEFLPKLDSEEMSINQVEKAMQGYINRQKEYAKSTDSFIKTKERLISKYPELRKQIEVVSKQVANGNITWSEGERVLRKVAQAHKDVSSAYQGLNKQISRVKDGLDRLKDAFKVTAAYGVAATAIYSVVNAFKSGLQAIVDYDQGLMNLQAITGATDSEVSAMGSTIENVAETTKFSTGEVAAGMVLLGQAGFDAGESISAIQATANLATGTLSDMATTTDLLTTTVRAFNLDAIESGRVADVMANAVNKSKLTIDKLRTAFNYVAATAAQAGISLEGTAATMMVLSNNGLRASSIGTGLRQVLSRLLKPNEKLGAALEAVGLNLKDIDPKTVGWRKTLESLIAVLYDSESKTVDMSKAFDLFSLRGSQAATVIVKSFVSGNYEQALQKVYELGTAEEMAAKQAKGLGVKIKNLVDRAKVLAVAVGKSGLAGVLKVVIDGFRALMSGLTMLVSTIGGQLVLQIAAWTASLWGAHKALMALFVLLRNTTVIQAFTMMFTGKAGLIGALTTAGSSLLVFLKRINPIILAVGALIPIIKLWVGAQDRAVKSAEQLAVKQMQVVNSIEAYKGGLKSIAEKILSTTDAQDAANVKQDEYLAMLNRLIKAHPELTGKIQMTIEAYEENDRVLQEFLSDANAEKLRRLIDLSREYGEAANQAQFWAGVYEAITQALNWLYEQAKSTLNLYVALWSTAISTILDYIGDLSNKIADLAEERFPLLGKIFAKVLRIIGDASKRAADTAKDAKQNVIDYYSEFGKGADSVKEAADKQKDTWDVMAQAFADVGKKQKRTLEEIEDAWRKAGGTNREEIEYIKVKVLELRDAEFEYKGTTKQVLSEMNDAWRKYFESLDTTGKWQLDKRWKQLQSQAADYKKFLETLGFSDQERQQALETWWNSELAKYQEKEAGKVDASAKTNEEIVRGEEETSKQIAQVKEKLQADIAAIMESGMTQQELIRKRDLEAHQAIEEAKKAITIANLEGATEAQKQAAIAAIEKAREAIDRMVEISKQGNTEIVDSTKVAASETTGAWTDAYLQQDQLNNRVTESARSGAGAVGSYWTDAAALTHDKWQSAGTTMISSMSETEKKAKDSNKEISDSSKKTTDELIDDWKNAKENVNKEISEIKQEGDNLIIKWREIKDGVEKMGSTIITRTSGMKDAAGEYKEELEKLLKALEGLKTEAEKEKKLNVNNEDAKTNIEAVDTAIGDLDKTVAKEDRKLKLDVEDAKTDIGTVDTAVGDLDTEITKDRSLKIDETPFLESIQRAIDKVKDLIDWLGKIPKNIDVNVNVKRNETTSHRSSDSDSSDFDTSGYSNYGYDKPGIMFGGESDYTVNFKGTGSTTKPLGEKIEEVGGWLASMREKAAEGASFVLSFMGKASKTEPLSLKIEVLQRKLAAFVAYAKTQNIPLKLDFEGYDPGSLEGLTAAFENAQEQFDNLKYLAKTPMEMVMDFQGSDGGTYGGLTDIATQTFSSVEDSANTAANAISDSWGQTTATVKTLVAGFEEVLLMVKKYGDIDMSPFLDGIQKAVDKVRDLIDWLGKIPKDIDFDSIQFLDSIQKAIDKVNELIDRLGNIPKDIDFIQMGQGSMIVPGAGFFPGFSTGGFVPGYGGGDTVPSMLERGEFVVKKEAVAKYGEGFFDKLNSMMPNIGKTGGGQLHTINLNVNNKPHTLYGDEQAINGLVKSLRRAQLLTA